MAGTFSSRKVARAARTGGGFRRSGESSVGWYFILVVICVLGTALVYVSREDRLDASNPGSTPPLAQTPDREGDHWYQAYGIYLCDKYLPNINNDANPYGISTRNDGIIYIHPNQKKYVGNNATVGLFGKAVGMKITRTQLQVPGDAKVYKTGEAKCGDKTGELLVKEWSNPTDESTGKVVKSDPKELLLKNNAAVTIAFVPTGTDEKTIKLPPSAANISQAAQADQVANSPSADPESEVPVSGDTPQPSPATTAAP